MTVEFIERRIIPDLAPGEEAQVIVESDDLKMQYNLTGVEDPAEIFVSWVLITDQVIKDRNNGKMTSEGHSTGLTLSKAELAKMMYGAPMEGPQEVVATETREEIKGLL